MQHRLLVFFSLACLRVAIGDRNTLTEGQQLVSVKKHGHFVHESGPFARVIASAEPGFAHNEGYATNAMAPLHRQDAFKCSSTKEVKCKQPCPYKGRAPDNKLCVFSSAFLCHWNKISQEFADVMASSSGTGSGVGLEAMDNEVNAAGEVAMSDFSETIIDITGPIGWISTSGSALVSLVQIIDFTCHGAPMCDKLLTSVGLTMTILGLALTLTGIGTPISSITSLVVGRLLSNYGPMACKLGLKGFAKYVLENIVVILSETGTPCPTAAKGVTDFSTPAKCLGEMATNFAVKLFKVVVALVKGLAKALYKLVVGVPKVMYKVATNKGKPPTWNTEVCCAHMEVRKKLEQALAEAFPSGEDNITTLSPEAIPPSEVDID